MDRYLFRAKRIDNGEWVEGHIIPTECGRVFMNYKDCLPIFNYSMGITFNHIIGNARPEVDPSTIGQCTGLKDKNGRLIFESDILFHKWNDGLQDKETISQVIYDIGAFWCDDCKRADFLLISHVDKSFANLEIIGNIHENSDLIV